MTTDINVRDEAAGATATGYHHSRVIEFAGRTVRARVGRGYYINQSLAVTEVLNEQLTLDQARRRCSQRLVAQHSGPQVPTFTTPTSILNPVTERLLQRATAIRSSSRTTRTLTPHLHGAISALLATTYGFDSERRIDPDEIAWAHTHGGALRIVEHPDGCVTFTKAHREDCPFITSAGTQNCDDNCHFLPPTPVTRWSTAAQIPWTG